MQKDVQHVFLVGAKSLGTYGGYETFINKLTEYHQHDIRIKYHVACKANGDGCMDETKVDGVSGIVKKNGETVEFTYHNARCFKIKIPEKLGTAQAIYYDVKSLEECCKYIKSEKLVHPIVYIMACRIGPFMKHFYKKIHNLGGNVYLNPDGHEWMRAKWSKPIRIYWKVSEQMMIKWSDLKICDSVNIEKYIHECYDGKGIRGRNPETTFIPYGAETRRSKLNDDDEKLVSWYESKDLKAHEYYLVVGRFVPENNYEIMLREYMHSNSKKDFAIITNLNNKFLDKLEEKLHFRADKRIKFVGTVYDQELLMKIRENAYGYLHGHEVGGTNPSLLEALGSTDLNLLLNVGFNREVAEDAALYWNKKKGNLATLIDKTNKISLEKRIEFGLKAKQRIRDAYSWQYIYNRYSEEFLGINKEVNRKMTNIEKLHEVDLNIVKEVIHICDEEELTYYMSGGTLLGAVRHCGFIPWDDDIDLAMPRDDYEKFLKIAPKLLPKNLQIINYKTNPKYQYYITRVLDTDTKVEEVRIGNDSKYTNASIDIFPLDGTPNLLWVRKIYFLRVMIHRALMSLCYKDSIDRNRKRSKAERIFLTFMEKLPIEKIVDPYKEKCKIDKIMRRHKVEDADNIGCLMGAYRTNQIVPKRYFGKGMMFQFETITLRGPELYDEYLTQMYDDYMKLPPKEFQKIHFRIVEIHGEKV